MPEATGKVLKITGNIVTVQLMKGDRMSYLTVGSDAGLVYDDGRSITTVQRNKIFAMLHEIDEHFGNFMIDLTEYQMKQRFCYDVELFDGFSLSDCSMSLATAFIEFLIKFCLAENVSFSSKTLDQIQGQYGWERACLDQKMCCICGKHADIAHVHAVGIGRDRNKIKHIGYQVMPLCRIHHNEQHNTGIWTFMGKYHLKGVRVTPEIAEMLRLGDWRVYREEPIISTK
ncbi:putative HNHc nuclease [Lactiplantibacillus mudanjiangensis]|uniref:DUF968 domain-containing protein n=1 Tax=Lactiplantibacillus mudanjiangensis TaxID=1296538 RepID=A0A660DXS2_9LACO|nr:putative HNHc nuclease [Lactiplantibacillus mudanjiangensis]VDG23694.1 hypothetical protein [Lactobacillus brevis] [Lactiplantibacillus mudanjiangensis]VDG27837.1 hypothetical protein [Lactobacillus brevis] [Lactiplantibacillus mudanjiangensis]